FGETRFDGEFNEISGLETRFDGDRVEFRNFDTRFRGPEVIFEGNNVEFRNNRTTFDGEVRLEGPVTDPKHATTKEYVDARIDTESDRARVEEAVLANDLAAETDRAQAAEANLANSLQEIKAALIPHPITAAVWQLGEPWVEEDLARIPTGASVVIVSNPHAVGDYEVRLPVREVGTIITIIESTPGGNNGYWIRGFTGLGGAMPPNDRLNGAITTGVQINNSTSYITCVATSYGWTINRYEEMGVGF
ncbi:MAG: hypothetical protein GY899_13090, partial [Verrucomicrobiaceae bacterium]|nr:hypothetical protein [Verrucomicrobiaceae bacterium]